MHCLTSRFDRREAHTRHVGVGVVKMVRQGKVCKTPHSAARVTGVDSPDGGAISNMTQMTFGLDSLHEKTRKEVAVSYPKCNTCAR